jgi:hypothetical protein
MMAGAPAGGLPTLPVWPWHPIWMRCQNILENSEFRR